MQRRLAIYPRVAEDRDVRRMLLRHNERQTNIAKFQEGPRRVLINDAAFEMRRVPLHGVRYIFYADCDVVQRVKFCSALRCAHSLRYPLDSGVLPGFLSLV